VLVIAGTGEVVVSCSVDIDRLRLRKTAFRASGHAYNPMVLMRSELFAGEYARAKRWPNDAFLEKPLTSTADAGAIARGILERLVDEKNLLRPESP
jgi:hypothetical protein